MLGAELQVAHKELHEMKDWLVAIQEKSALPSPHKKMPIRQGPTGPPGSQRGESEAGNSGDKKGDKAEDGKMDMLPQCIVPYQLWAGILHNSSFCHPSNHISCTSNSIMWQASVSGSGVS